MSPGPQHSTEDTALDALLAQARPLSADDEGAAARFLTGHRTRQARQRHGRQVRAGWVSALLATAAVVAGVTALRPGSASGELPSSAAYQTYESAIGEGW